MPLLPRVGNNCRCALGRHLYDTCIHYREDNISQDTHAWQAKLTPPYFLRNWISRSVFLTGFKLSPALIYGASLP